MKRHENDMTCKRHESNMKIFENNIKRNGKTWKRHEHDMQTT